MKVLQVDGDAFSEYFLTHILPTESRLIPRLDPSGADRAWHEFNNLLRHAQRELRGSHQARVTRRVLLDPIARLFSWHVGEPSAVVTSLGEETGSQPLFLNGTNTAFARVMAVSAEASLDLPPEGLHRRFAPAHSLVRMLEREGLTWGLLVNAFELRLVRRGEGFTTSHLSFGLLDMAGDVAGARAVWRLLWGLLRHDVLTPAPALLDEVVQLGREHQQEVGSLLGEQVPSAVESLLQGALDHQANRGKLQPFLRDLSHRVELLEHLHAGSLRYLYRILFVLYAEARGLLPLDMPTYRDGYALTGSHGLVHRVMNPATDPRRIPEATTGFFASSLRALFVLLRDGVDLGPEGRIPVYGGGLFHPHHDPNSLFPTFDDLALGDRTVAQVLELLTHVSTRRGKVTLSYRELDVEQLGALYEGLLERTVDYVGEHTGPLWRIRLDGDIVLVTEEQLNDLRKRRGDAGSANLASEETEDQEDNNLEEELAEGQSEDESEERAITGKKKPIRVLEATTGAPNPIPVGSVVLRPGLSRKQSGSYYTNRAFVEYLVRRAVDPLAEGKRPEQILQLAVCDPAMGSGHFLVEACRRIAEHLLVAYKTLYAEEAASAEANSRERYQHELLFEAGIHAELAAVWGDEPTELAVCRRLVAFHCIYGVDKNPLAVELARVSLWLATLASDHPLTFLDHRLVCGDALLGITIEDLLRAFSIKSGKKRKSSRPLVGESDDQSELPYFFARNELYARLTRAFRYLRTIEQMETEQAGDFEDQQRAYGAMQGELEDFAVAHQLRVGRAFLDESNPAADPLLANQWMKEIQDQHYVSQETRARAVAATKMGKELRAFCWELAFPGRFFEPDPGGERIRRRERPGFDAMVGNPPWDKLEPKRKEFFAAYDPAIRDFQGQTLARRIALLAPDGSEAWRRWKHYEAIQRAMAKLLVSGGTYGFQVVEVNGEKTGGKPDLFKLFLERFHQLASPGGRVGVLMPAGLYALEGATGVRRLLFSQAKVEALYSFENWGKRFFPIHASFKFLTLVFTKEGGVDQSFPAAFMLRDEKFLALPEANREMRSVRITSEFIRLTNPVYLSIVELRDNHEREFVERIYKEVPALAQNLEEPGTWNVEVHRELNMTDDAWRFRTRDWLMGYGCEQSGSSFSARSAAWYKQRPAEFVPGTRYVLLEGTKYRVASAKPIHDEKKRGTRGHEIEALSGFLRSQHVNDDNELPVIPDAIYVPLYEGRMIQQYDNAAKAYVSGEGRGAQWRDLDFSEKALVPHFYVDGTNVAVVARAGFCDVTGQTNERSMLAALLPAGMPAGNSVPTVTTVNLDCHLVWVAAACSFVAEFLIRQKISTHLNFFYVGAWPLIRPNEASSEFTQLRNLAARLVSVTPEIQLAEPALDLRERAHLRTKIDAIVAGRYKLSPAEFGYILTTFPLLDRDQPSLPGDAFVRWNKQGKPKAEPRSYVTRDTVLQAYFHNRNLEPPKDLAGWYRDEVGLNMIDDESCPYRMGAVRGLEERVAEYYRRGAIAYVPSKARMWNPHGPYRPPDLPTDWNDWIVEDPAICGGRPTLRGTRLELQQVQDLLQHKTFSEILSSFPQLDNGQVAVALVSMSHE